MPPLGALKSVCVAPSSLPTSDPVVDEGGRAHGCLETEEAETY